MKRGLLAVLNVVAALACGAPAISSADPSVQSEIKPTEQTLRGVEETVKRMYRVAGEVHSEVNRRDYITIGPDLADTYPSDPWYNYNAGMFPTALNSGFQTERKTPILPPRKRYIDSSMSEYHQLRPFLDQDLAMLKTDPITQSKTPDAEEFGAQYVVAAETDKRLQALESKLDKLTKNAPYDNKAISETTEDMRDQLKSLDMIDHRMRKLLQRIH